jgi:hypothetical protein
VVSKRQGREVDANQPVILAVDVCSLARTVIAWREMPSLPCTVLESKPQFKPTVEKTRGQPHLQAPGPPLPSNMDRVKRSLPAAAAARSERLADLH